MNANLTIDERRWNCRRQLLLDLEESDQNREEHPIDFKNWRTQEWIDHFDQRQQAKVSILCGLCESILYMRSLQGHSGGKTELILRCKTACVQLQVNYLSRFVRFDAGRIVGGKEGCQGGQTCFFIAVDLVNEPSEDRPNDEGEPREVPYRTKWKVSQHAVLLDRFVECSGWRIGSLANEFQCNHL